MSSHPGIFSKHDKKQVSHRNKGDRHTDRQTKRKKGKTEVEEK